MTGDMTSCGDKILRGILKGTDNCLPLQMQLLFMTFLVDFNLISANKFGEQINT